MSYFHPSRHFISTMFLAFAMLLLLGCQTMPSGNTPTGSCCAANGTCSVTTQANCTGAWASGGTCASSACTKAATLFVVNNNSSVTSYANAFAANGDIDPTTDLPSGGGTQIFQPRSIVVTRTGQLIVSRQNSGVTVHDNATTVTGNTVANRVVEGSKTMLDEPIAFALDAANDRLFVGDAGATKGVLVFEKVSAVAFNGDVAPNRTFNPPDRAPDTTINMSISAMDLDTTGALYVAESAFPNNNTDEIVVFTSPGTASGSTPRARTLTSSAWDRIQDLAVDRDDVLYVVDGTDSVFIFKKASTLKGAITPDAKLTPQGFSIGLHGVVIASNGRGFLADIGNGAVYSFANIATRSGVVKADTTITGSHTNLSSPRQMFLLEP